MKLAQAVERAVYDVAGLFFPQLCPICRARSSEEFALCEACLAHLRQLKSPLSDALKDRLKLPEGLIVMPLSVRAAFPYEDAKVVQAIAVGKYREGPAGLGALARLWAERLLESQSFNQPDYVLAVPLHPKRLRERGYNQAELITKAFGKTLSVTVLPYALTRTRATVSQTTLSAAERQTNVAGAFVVAEKFKPLLHGKHVMVLDDVLTTGSTLLACAEALADAGADKITLGALAATRMRG